MSECSIWEDNEVKLVFQPKYKLTLLHKLVIFFLLLTGISSIFINKSGYYEKCYHEKINYFNLLHEGNYVITIRYSELPEGSDLIIYTKNWADQYNQAGVEIARMPLQAGNAEVETEIHIDRDTNRIYVVTTADTEDQSYIDQVSASAMQLLDYDNYYIALIYITTAMIILILGLYVDYKKYYRFALLIVIGMIASFPFFSDFLIVIQDFDLKFHFARVNGIYAGICAGEFPVRINSVQTEGLGNISATMYPALFLYPIAMLHVLRMSTVLAYKMVMTTANIGAAAFTFYGVKSMCRSEKMGWAASIFYTFSLYRLNDMYMRGAVGEVLAMTFFPLVIWGAYEILYGRKKRWYILMIGMTGVIESHVLSTEMCAIFLAMQGLLFVFSKRTDNKLKRVGYGVIAVVGTVLLNMSFLVPFLHYYREKFVVFSLKNALSGRAVYFSQMFTLFSKAQGVDCARGYTTGEMPLTLGAPLVIGVLAFVLMQTLKRNYEKKYRIGVQCLVWGCIAALAASWFFPWGYFDGRLILDEIATSLQFPWRMLAPASMFLSIVAAAGIEMLTEQKHFRWIAGTIIVLEFVSVCYLFDNMVYDAETFNKKQAETSTAFDYLYMYADNTDLQNTTIVYDTAGTDAAYYEYDKRGSRVKFDIVPSQPSREENYLVFPLYYYPGYEVTIDGEKQEVLKINDRVACKMPDAAAHVEAYYAGFLSFRIADMITLVTVIVMLAWFVYSVVFRKLPLDFCSKQEYDN